MPANAKYHALIIGSNNYKYLPKLKTAIADAKAVEEILRTRYGFTTKLLIDATREDILNGMNDLRKGLGEKDNLLIYYAGHGEFDKTADKSYWIPVNAERDNPTNWIIADDITSNIKRITSRHILIVSDSCYSGTLTRAVSGDLSKSGEREEFIKKMMEKPSRTLMASGGNEPVADSGGGGHSVFASAFLKALKETEKNIFTAEELFHGRGSVKEMVAGKSDQVPEYNTIKNSGHDGGDFVFQLANAGSILKIEPAKIPSSKMSEEMKKLKEERERLEAEREELEQNKALMEEKKHLEEERQKLEKEKLEVASLQPPPPPVQPKAKLAEKGNMILIPSGEFMAGSPNSLKGMVINAFYMDKYEVTQRKYEQVMGKNPSRFKGSNLPVEHVTWYEADEYCGKVGKRLPTEWEWEKAAKAGTTTEYYWGNEVGKNNANCSNCGSRWDNKETAPVGSFKPNAYGLYDMAGNVWEWTNSDYDGSGKYKIFRGGAWFHGADIVRSSFRNGLDIGDRSSADGFRCVQ